MNTDYGSVENFDRLSDYDLYCLFKETVPSNFINSPFLKPLWIKLNGQTYKKDSCVVIDYANGFLPNPVFGIVSLILINDEQKVILVCQVCCAVRFDKNFHAYVIEKTNECDCILSDNLISPFLVIIVQLGNNHFYATLRHSL